MSRRARTFAPLLAWTVPRESLVENGVHTADELHVFAWDPTDLSIIRHRPDASIARGISVRGSTEDCSNDARNRGKR